MLTCKRVDLSFPGLTLISDLYERSFPANEKRSLATLLKDETGVSDFLAFYEDEAFVGFVCLLKDEDIVHIIYFAVEVDLRGKGIGGRILDAVAAKYPGCRVIADLERPLPGTESEALRKRRAAFYERNGFEETEVQYNWRGEEYFILSRGGLITDAEFDAFWEHIEKKDERFGSY